MFTADVNCTEIMGILIALKDWLKPALPPDPAVQRALDRACIVVEPMLNTVPGLEKKLSAPIQRTLAHCQQLVAELPGPVEVDRQAFAKSPLVHALFSTSEDIAQMLGKSQSVRDYLIEESSEGSDFFYAMLAARPQVKKTLGVAYNGDVLQADAAIEYLFFSDHVLVEPALTLETAMEKLRQTALDSLLKNFHSRLKTLREKRQTLRETRDLERDRIGVLRGQGKMQEVETYTRHFKELENQLRDNINAMLPERLVDELADFLSAPEKALHLEDVSISVNRSGVVANSDNVGDALIFKRINGRDRRRYIGLLVKIRREDAVEAVAQMEVKKQRYLLF